MKQEYEIVAHSRIKHLNLFVNHILFRSVHMHSDIEVLFILDGNGVCHIRQQEYELHPGSMLLINSNEPHDISGTRGPITTLILQFSPRFLKSYFPALQNTLFLEADLNAVLPRKVLLESQRHFIGAGIEYVTGSEYYELSCISEMTAFLKDVFLFVPHQVISDAEHDKNKKQVSRMMRLSAHLEDHYQEPIRLTDLAASENITVTHLSHLFTEQFGVTFQEQLNRVRFEHALRLIADTGLTLTEVSERSGFSELKYMTKMFETQLGMKPAEFRANIPPIATLNIQKMEKDTEYFFPPEEALQELIQYKV